MLLISYDNNSRERHRRTEVRDVGRDERKGETRKMEKQRGEIREGRERKERGGGRDRRNNRGKRRTRRDRGEETEGRDTSIKDRGKM